MNLYTLIAAALVLGAFYGLYEGVRKPLAIQRGAVMLLVMFLMLAAGVLWGLSGTIPAVSPAATAHAGASVSAAAKPGASSARVSGEAAFVAFALPYARTAHAATGWPVSVILAQWGLENGWQEPRFDGFNFGSVKYDQVCPTTTGGFCDDATAQDGLRDYLICAALPYYSGIAAAAKSGGATAAAVALGQSPWDAGAYTHDGHPGDDLLAIMTQFHLTQYDS